MIRVFKLLLLVICFCSCRAFAQVFLQKKSAVNITSSQFQNHNVSALAMDANGRIWIGTLNGLFVSKGIGITPFLLLDANDKVVSTLYLHHRYLYVGTNEGISRIHIDSFTSTRLQLKDENGNSIHNYCMVVHVIGDKLLYYTGYNTASYYEYDLKTGKSKFLFNHSDGFRAIKTDARGNVTKLWAIETTGLLEHDLLRKPVSTHYYFKDNNNPPVLSIFEARLDSQDTLWCATNKGLFGMDINTHQYKLLAFPQYGVYEINDAVLHGQDVICGTANAGIIIWNRITNNTTQILHRPDDAFSLLSNKIEKLQLVNKSLLLAATNGGISTIPLDAALQFAYTSRSGGEIRNIIKGKQRWLAGIDNSIQLLNANTFVVKDSLPLAQDEYTLTAKEVDIESWLVITNKQVLWWNEGRAQKLNAEPARHVICERIVKQNDSNYYLCGQTGIYTWHVGDGHIVPLTHADKEPYQWYNTVIPLNDSILFSNAYLSFIKGHRKEGNSLQPLVLFKMFSNVQDWLITSPQSLLLAGTNGISKLDMKHKNLQFSDTAFHENIYRFICRTGDTLLVGERGLYRYKAGKVVPYPTPFSGLQNITGPDRLITDNKYIWYANGAELYRMPLQILVDKTKYYYTDVRYRGIVAGNSIELPANTNLQLAVSSISYLPYVKPKIQYRLSGIENSWNTLDGEQIRYTQLRPGTYTLIVQATAGIQTLYYKSITIIARPAWYQTVWATIAFVLLLIAIVVVIFRWRVRVINRKAQQALSLQRQLNELENKALRAQMNPHFLFNTLNSINHYILNNDTQEASHYLTRFSKLVRLVLDNSRREYISLERELEALNIYLELEMMRRNNEFDYSISVRKEVTPSSFLVPPLILQPFVENAIWHGLSTVSKDGFIEITVTAIGKDGICITIEDNGIGYKAPAPNAKKSHSSFGMAGTHDRLTLMHPQNDYKIETLYNDDGSPSGTRVSVYIYND